MSEIQPIPHPDVEALEKRERRALRKRRASVLPLLLDVVEHLTHARGETPFYVQVGAHDGITADPMYDRAITKTWSGLLLEPSSVYCEKLKTLYADRDDMKIRQLGVSSKKSKLSLYRVHEDHLDPYPEFITGCASLDRGSLLGHMARHSPDAEDHIVAETVQLDPLRTILTREKIKRIDALIIDVEGHEVEVFDSFDLKKTKPTLVMFEHKHLARKVNRELATKFTEQGYRVAKVGQDTVMLPQALATPGLWSAIEGLGAALVDPE